MKKLIVLALLSVFIFPAVQARDTKVDGYYRSDGRNVEPHYRLSPNKTQNDNWSTFGNSNPNTRQPGVKIDRTYDPNKNLR